MSERAVVTVGGPRLNSAWVKEPGAGQQPGTVPHGPGRAVACAAAMVWRQQFMPLAAAAGPGSRTSGNAASTTMVAIPAAVRAPLRGAGAAMSRPIPAAVAEPPPP